MTAENFFHDSVDQPVDFSVQNSTQSIGIEATGMLFSIGVANLMIYYGKYTIVIDYPKIIDA